MLKPLSLSLVSLCFISTSAHSASVTNKSMTNSSEKDIVSAKPQHIEHIEIKGDATINDAFPYNLNTISDSKILAGKKVSIVDLSLQPTFVEPNLRQVFSRLPGLFVSDQTIPSIYNVNYRGLGNPHESEFVAFYQNGIPLASDMFGYATIYYIPPAQRIERIEFVRGGAGLLYGPQIGPTINFLTSRANADLPDSALTEHSFGNNGFYSTYNEVRLSQGDLGFMASVDHRTSSGQRSNEDFEVNSAYLGVSYKGLDDVRLGFDLDIYQSDSGEAGRLSSSEFNQNRYLVKNAL